MKHELHLTLETAELARLAKIATRQGLSMEEAARDILRAAVYKEELTVEDEVAIRVRTFPPRRPLEIRLDTADEYRPEKMAEGLHSSMEAAAHSLLSVRLGKNRMTPRRFCGDRETTGRKGTTT